MSPFSHIAAYFPKNAAFYEKHKIFDGDDALECLRKLDKVRNGDFVRALYTDCSKEKKLPKEKLLTDKKLQEILLTGFRIHKHRSHAFHRLSEALQGTKPEVTKLLEKVKLANNLPLIPIVEFRKIMGFDPEKAEEKVQPKS